MENDNVNLNLNINIGLCHRRTQEGKPPYFVNWNRNGINYYEFYDLRFLAEDKKNNLELQNIL